MKFLVDEQLPPALARWLEGRGHQAEHVLDAGLLRLDDQAIALRAVASGSVVVTKDKDYDLWRVRLPGLQVLWLLLGNVSNRVLLERLDEAWPGVIERLGGGTEMVTVSPGQIGP